MLSSAIELITLVHDTNYAPTFVSTDKRIPSPNKTSIGYWQIGELQQYGFAYGPIFRIEFVNLSAVAPTHVKIWGLENQDDTAPIYPKSYLTNATFQNHKIDIYLKKFSFCNSAGVVAPPGGEYLVVGHKKKVMPLVW